MPRGDGKSNFYRTLHLDKESWETLKEFNKIKRKMINEIKRRCKNEHKNDS